jgi:hypothetical protein
MGGKGGVGVLMLVHADNNTVRHSARRADANMVIPFLCLDARKLISGGEMP